MKTISIIALVLIAATLHASPFLVSDPQSGAQEYRFTGDSFFFTKAAEPDGSIRFDLAGIPDGVHNIAVSVCNLWGCSVTVPFAFTASKPVVPKGLKLAP